MKFCLFFGGFWDKPIKNGQKIIITDVLVNEKCHDSNRTATNTESTITIAQKGLIAEKGIKKTSKKVFQLQILDISS